MTSDSHLSIKLASNVASRGPGGTLYTPSRRRSAAAIRGGWGGNWGPGPLNKLRTR